jgi:hypothetical protein
MKLKLYIFILLFFNQSIINAQDINISKESTSTPPRFSKNDYIGNIIYNDDGTTTLHYVQKQPLEVIFKNYTYDKDFNLVKDDVDHYTLGEQMRDQWKEKFSWFNYKGENYVVEGISVDPTWGGKLLARKKITTWKYNALFGGYYPIVKTTDIQKLKGADDNRVYLYHRAEDYQNGNVVLLVGNKASKESKIKKSAYKAFSIDDS